MTEYDGSFTITPMSQRIELNPGEVYHGQIKIGNAFTAKKELRYQVSLAPLGFAGDTYDADLVTESNYTMVTKWITIDEPTGVLQPNESKEISFTINVPEDVPAGGQYASILVSRDDSADADENALEIGSVLEMASLLYARVNGETRSEGEVLTNEIPGFVTELPVSSSIKIKNNGNIDSVITPVIKATNFFTGEVIIDGNNKDSYKSETILPDTTRSVVRELENMPSLGIVHVEQIIFYDGKQLSSISKEIFICPIWFMVLVGVSLVVIAVIIRILIKKSRAKKQLYI